ncbi:MAG: glucose-6-phosphate isomerase [Deltaproteobacteria bacterium]|nr:glucose-6-phosphate isomerase [Deltaproteobacteria bacterium]
MTGCEKSSGRAEFSLSGPLSSALYDAVRLLDKIGFSERLFAKDPTLWKDGPEERKQIANSLGWLDLPSEMAGVAGEIKAFASGIRKEGFKRAVLLGMGGSSLAPLVLSESFGKRPGHPDLIVLDSTDPDAVRLVDEASRSKTLFIVSSKSGSTIEPLSLFEHFYGRLRKKEGSFAGNNFIALTDPGSLLERTARERSFRRVFQTPPDVGGRFSALSFFGLIPAAISGIDISRLIQSSLIMSFALRQGSPLIKNPGVMLGAALGAFYLKGRDKLTVITSKEVSSFGLWIEQLIAESTGKEGRGIIPISGELLSAPSGYSDDRVFVYIGAGAPDKGVRERLFRLSSAGHPVISFHLKDRYALGGEFLRWEAATSAAGIFLRINPFDQPDVELSKRLTRALLENAGRKGRKACPRFRHAGAGFVPPGKKIGGRGMDVYLGNAALKRIQGPGIKKKKAGFDFKGALKGFFSLIGKDSYIGILAYMSPFDKKTGARLKRLRKAVLLSTKAATQFGYGPRYLHSTGQLHKGGADNGAFIILARRTSSDAEIPGSPFGFRDLEISQACGDMEALDSKGRSTVFFSLKDASRETFDRLRALIRDAARQ